MGSRKRPVPWNRLTLYVCFAVYIFFCKIYKKKKHVSFCIVLSMQKLLRHLWTTEKKASHFCINAVTSETSLHIIKRMDLSKQFWCPVDGKRKLNLLIEFSNSIFIKLYFKAFFLWTCISSILNHLFVPQM